ncbi:hypothetical protein V5735_03000 (plasmid) [Haladaptatus sp. SPP-AMP-3]|uniref:hypothetical protein n=1 Tax=Haladaptatus sp. SPP-AMP-3 TaxID=3121295 RepID=UPI003C2DB3AE
MSPWLVTYTFRDGSTVRRTLDAPTIDDAYEASTLPKTIGDRVLDGITIEERAQRSDGHHTSIRFGEEERCTEPTPQPRMAESGERVRKVAGDTS